MQHRTDHLSAAVRQLRKEEQEGWTVRYQALIAHNGMQPTWNNTGSAHENGACVATMALVWKALLYERIAEEVT